MAFKIFFPLTFVKLCVQCIEQSEIMFKVKKIKKKVKITIAQHFQKKKKEKEEKATKRKKNL